jgi:hypothetical protein
LWTKALNLSQERIMLPTQSIATAGQSSKLCKVSFIFSVDNELQQPFW